jgi:tRNA pseudouridine38-40 synthase
MARIAVGIEYDGSAYHGWQSQLGTLAVQSVVERALGVIANHPVNMVVAGRTDAGVHAVGQVAHFDSHAARADHAWVMGANATLPADINLRWATVVPDHFHARFSAQSRSYRYLILNRAARSALAARRAWLVRRQLDVGLMQSAAEALLGEHDFSAFRAAECQAKSPVRAISGLQVRRSGDWVIVAVTANAFLQHMVRNIVGTLVAVGRGDAAVTRAQEQLASLHRPSGEATAAAHGLYLWHVSYPAAFGLPADSAMMTDLAGLQDS